MDLHELKILLSHMLRSKGIFPDYNHVISQCQENIFNKANMTLSILNETKIVTITCVKSEPLGYYEFERGLKPYTDEDVKRLKGESIGNWLLGSHFGKNRDSWHEKKNFAELVSNLSAELRKVKASKEYIPFFEALPIGRRCQSCGKRMGSEEDKTREEVLCEVCYIKRSRGTGEKLRFLEEFDKWIRKNGLEIENILNKFPKDLEELTRVFGGYMAFIYADGNDIGSLLEKASSPTHYRHIAEELHKGTRDSIFGAIFDVFGKERRLSNNYLNHIRIAFAHIKSDSSCIQHFDSPT